MIRSGTFPSTKKLQDKFEVSRATIMRDLEFLRDRYNAPLEYNYEKHGYFYSDPTFFVQSVMLSEGELFSVSVIQPLLSQYRNTTLESSIKNIFSKISEMLPNEDSVNTGFLGNDITFISDPLPEIEEEIFTNVFSSMRTHRTITFQYRSATKNCFAQHKANVYHVLSHKGNWYILAYDFNHEKVITFALQRMKDIVIENETFTIPKDFNPSNYYDSSFGVWHYEDEPVKISLLFKKELAAYISERIWHETQEITENDDGTILLSFCSNQLRETLKWIVQFGSNVKVIKPKVLEEMLTDECSKILELYKQK